MVAKLLLICGCHNYQLLFLLLLLLLLISIIILYYYYYYCCYYYYSYCRAFGLTREGRRPAMGKA